MKTLFVVLAIVLAGAGSVAATPKARTSTATAPSKVSAPAPAPVPTPATSAVPAAPAPAAHPAISGKSDCGSCHNEIRWSEVRFDHDRTGFALEGAHGQTSCRSCHRRDFRAHVADTCAGCHRDRHAGSLGAHCEGCHGETDWHAVAFWADGHRNTRFPLVGKHGAIPCQECHGNMRDRTFSPTSVACVACHRADFDGAALKSIDHVAVGFGTECQTCHSTTSFFPARFDAHDLCFVVSTGSHRGLRCAQCHSSTVGLRLNGACNTQTTTCTSCHTHDCSRSDPLHANVMGYACANQKCYQCHQPLR